MELTKKILIVLGILMVVGTTVWWWKETMSLNTPEEYVLVNQVKRADDDSLDVINKDLKSVDTGDVDSSFKEIDSEIGNL